MCIRDRLGSTAFDALGAAGRWVRLACYLADYAVIGYDILKKMCIRDSSLTSWS